MVDVAYGGDFRPTTSHTVAATLNKSLASHLLKGGVEMRIYREDSLSTANATSGQYTFTNAYTRQNSASGGDFNGLQAYAVVPARAALHHVDPAAPRTTPSTRRPGASSCRTTGGSTTS